MQFSVIYSVDGPYEADGHHPDLRDLAPDPETLPGDWNVTEPPGPSDVFYDEDPDEYGHIKMMSLLDRDDFESFLGRTGLYATEEKTMGSLGAPGFGVVHAPAICFQVESFTCVAEAYVTPVPEFDPHPNQDEERARKQWDRLRRVVIDFYSY